MNENKNSVIRVVLILGAILSIVLAVITFFHLSDGAEEDDAPQADLSGYGESTEPTDYSDGLIFEDDSTVEMDSIPNDAITSGGDVSGTDVSASDAESTVEGEEE